MSKEVFSSIFPPPVNEEKLSKESRVEKAGYVSTKKRIEAFFSAGGRLLSMRKEQYDTDQDVDVPIDPTRRPGIDMAEVSQLKHEAVSRLTAKAVDTSKKRPKVAETPKAS